MYVALVAAVAILLLQGTGLIPVSSVGGPLTIGLAFIAAALALGLREAWVNRRGPLGWAINMAASFFGALIGAQAGGIVVVMLIGAVMDIDGSLARTGGLAMSFALIGGLFATLAGAGVALWIVNRFRPAPHAA